MILNNSDLIKLKVLILGETDEEDEVNCMECRPDNPRCGLVDMCNRYGSFNFVEGAKDIVRDLFDTIEYIKGENH